MELPPPTTLTDVEFVEHLRIVVDGTLDALLLNSDKVDLIRQGVSGLLIDAQGVIWLSSGRGMVPQGTRHL